MRNKESTSFPLLVDGIISWNNLYEFYLQFSVCYLLVTL